MVTTVMKPSQQDKLSVEVGERIVILLAAWSISPGHFSKASEETGLAIPASAGGPLPPSTVRSLRVRGRRALFFYALFPKQEIVSFPRV